METRANYILIGAFTMAVIACAFGFVYWFHHVGGTGARDIYKIVFQGPISGLRAGSGVVFNGVRVGEVTSLGLDPKNPQQAYAVISVDATAPVRADTRAALEFQGLTGIANLSLRGGSLAAARLAGKDGEPATIRADAGSGQDVMQSARDVMTRLDSFIETNQVALKNSIKNIEIFTEALAKNTERFDRVMAGFDNLVGGADGKGEIPEAARAIRTAAENLDKRIDTLTQDARRTLATFDRTIKNIDSNPSRLIFGGAPAGRSAQPAR